MARNEDHLQLTDEEYALLKDFADKNKDGRLSHDEIHELVQLMKHSPSSGY